MDGIINSWMVSLFYSKKYRTFFIFSFFNAGFFLRFLFLFLLTTILLYIINYCITIFYSKTDNNIEFTYFGNIGTF